MLLLLLAMGCTGGAECEPCPDCEGVSATPGAPAAGGATLESWEAQVLGPDLEALRAGIQPRGEQGLGVCAGKNECESFKGAAAGELEEGPHILFAELDVPRLGEGWQVRFDLSCEVQTPSGASSTVDHSKTYKVVHTGEKRGYRLSPLWKIQSPHPQGRRECKYSLTPLRPDGVEGAPLTGDYATPMPETP